MFRFGALYKEKKQGVPRTDPKRLRQRQGGLGTAVGMERTVASPESSGTPIREGLHPRHSGTVCAGEAPSALERCNLEPCPKARCLDAELGIGGLSFLIRLVSRSLHRPFSDSNSSGYYFKRKATANCRVQIFPRRPHSGFLSP